MKELKPRNFVTIVLLTLAVFCVSLGVGSGPVFLLIFGTIIIATLFWIGTRRLYRTALGELYGKYGNQRSFNPASSSAPSSSDTQRAAVEPLPHAIPMPDGAAAANTAWPAQPEAPSRTFAALADELTTPRNRPQANPRPQPAAARPEARQETRQERRQDARLDSRQEPRLPPQSAGEASPSTDQALAEMAQRLEAALRKPVAKADRNETREPSRLEEPLLRDFLEHFKKQPYDWDESGPATSESEYGAEDIPEKQPPLVQDVIAPSEPSPEPEPFDREPSLGDFREDSDVAGPLSASPNGLESDYEAEDTPEKQPPLVRDVLAASTTMPAFDQDESRTARRGPSAAARISPHLSESRRVLASKYRLDGNKALGAEDEIGSAAPSRANARPPARRRSRSKKGKLLDGLVAIRSARRMVVGELQRVTVAVGAEPPSIFKARLPAPLGEYLIEDIKVADHMTVELHSEPGDAFEITPLGPAERRMEGRDRRETWLFDARPRKSGSHRLQVILGVPRWSRGNKVEYAPVKEIEVRVRVVSWRRVGSFMFHHFLEGGAVELGLGTVLGIFGASAVRWLHPIIHQIGFH